MELFIGIDWASEDHDVYLTNEIGEDLDSFAIEDSLLRRSRALLFASQLKHRMDLW